MGKIVVFDIECNGLNPDRIHCLSVKGKKLKSTASYDNMRSFFNKAEVLVGHNIVRYDIPVVERILGVKPKAKLVDTLALSWYLYPDRIKHGLEDWGEYFGIPKPVVKDWEGLSTEEYIHRCEEDVKINTKLWNKMWAHLKKLYGSEEEAWRFIEYITFKMECARKQEELRWKLDVPLCERNLKELEKLKEEKVIALIEAMPKVPKYAKKSKPKTMYKIDGSLSVHGKKWFDLLAEQKLPEDYDGDVRYVQSYEEPKPTSSVQIKSWLVSLGWVPQTFKYKRDKETNEFTQIPQVNLENGKGICPSIKKLYDKEPSLELLDGLSVLTHRISLLRGFLDAVDEEGYVKAQIQGLTNTLRFKHKVVVNLPGVDKPYGTYIRGCLTAPTGYQLVGSDMSSLFGGF